jgi:amino acid transporter
VITLFSEGALLFVGAQAGFIDGPRVLANMAVDSWVPRRFADLSDRLTTQNGILLMGMASLAALLYTRGLVTHLVVMYSINVFLTFSLSMFGMLKHWLAVRKEERIWLRRAALFFVGFLLCATILCITTFEKFEQGGWVTVAATSLLIGLCFAIRGHYNQVAGYIREFDKTFRDLPIMQIKAEVPPIDPKKPTAAILVGGYGGTGIHLVLNILKAFPNYFHNIIFLSVGIIDSGKFKGEAELEALKESTESSLRKYVDLAHKLGLPADFRMSIGTEVVDQSEKLCREVAREFPHTIFYAGQVMFKTEKWYHRLLHNQTSFYIQKRLHWNGLTMVILPMRVNQ